MKSIYVVGPSSSGKTTLCKGLASKLPQDEYKLVSEVARSVMASQNYSRDDIGSLELQKAIMTAQIRQENIGISEKESLLCDRSAIDPIMYAMLTAQNFEERKSRQDTLTGSSDFQSVLGRYKESIFVLLEPVPEWLEDDGIRHVGDESQCFALYRELLTDFGITYFELGLETKDLTERVEVVLKMSEESQAVAAGGINR